MKSSRVRGLVSHTGSEGRKGRVLVIGGGVAGLTVSSTLSSLGHAVSLIERSGSLGGRTARLSALFPSMGSPYAVIDPLIENVLGDANVQALISAEAVSGGWDGGRPFVELGDGRRLEAEAMVIATGLEAVPAGLVPEFGHGLRKGVLTSSGGGARPRNRGPMEACARWSSSSASDPGPREGACPTAAGCAAPTPSRTRWP